jgi:hypothetical protein
VSDDLFHFATHLVLLRLLDSSDLNDWRLILVSWS